MTIGNKLAKLRKENNLTQEQLSELLGVSRQAISKWEGDVAYPETDKILRLAELYHCSTDYLLRDSVETETLHAKNPDSDQDRKVENSFWSVFVPERKSSKTWHGMPLWATGKHAKGVVAVGLEAKGIIAIGYVARGVVSIGLVSMGIFSLGLLSLGLLAFGAGALGFIAGGSFTAGVIAFGAYSYGIVSFGALAGGDFCFGASASGKYLAVGDEARAMIAVGKSEAHGSLYEKVGTLSKEEIANVKMLLDENVPKYLSWAKAIAEHFIK